MEQITLADWIGLHKYLTALVNPSPKMKETLERVETELHRAITTCKRASLD